jgi:hypothetical protein
MVGRNDCYLPHPNLISKGLYKGFGIQIYNVRAYIKLYQLAYTLGFIGIYVVTSFNVLYAILALFSGFYRVLIFSRVS